MPRSYNQHCTVAKSLDLVGERWTLLIVRELLTGPKRYKDLMANLPGIGTNLLANRLKDMAEERLVESAPDEGGYALTPDGEALEPVVLALIRWGLPRLGKKFRDDLWRAAWTPLTFKALFDAERAKGVQASVVFEVDGETFFVRVDDGHLYTGPGRPSAAGVDAAISCSANDFLKLTAGVSGIEKFLRSRGVKSDRDALRLAELFGCFPLPEKNG